jgi:lipopolysaccharide transport system permease protein
VLQPLSTMVVFTLFFGRLAGVASDGVPYPLFSFAALVPWTFFSNGLTLAAGSVVANQALVTKVYFPRLIIPFSTILSGALDFAIAFGILLLMMLAYGVWPSARIVAIVPLLLLTVVSAAGAGTWLSALNVKYRDVRYVTNFLAQLWLFATPIAYSSSIVPERWRPLYGINPMVGVVDGFRWALVGGDAPHLPTMLTSCAFAAILFTTGAIYFRRMESTFADIA